MAQTNMPVDATSKPVSAADPPSYTPSQSASWDTTEKPEPVAVAPCATHGPSNTPHVDSYLRQPNTKATMQVLISALSDAVNDEQCTKCAMETITTTVGTYMQELKAAKKNGQMSREDKKAVKGELKTLFNSVKGDVKAMRKNSA